MYADLISRSAKWLCGTPVYWWTLSGPAPRHIEWTALPSPHGDPLRGRRILSGVLPCTGAAFNLTQPRWLDAAADHTALAELHGFDYLADLSSIGEDSKTYARAMIASWLDQGSRWHQATWAPDVLGHRITAWLTCGKWLFRGRDDPLEPRVLASIGRQLRHLGRAALHDRGGVPRLFAIKGLIYGGAVGLGSKRLLNRGLAALGREIAHQILPNGGHIERSPLAQYLALSAFVDIRAVLKAYEISIPKELSNAIASTAPVLRLFRHGDGGLALFNGSTEGSSGAIDALLTRTGARAPTPISPNGAGFQRLSAGMAVVIQDVGAPPPPGFDAASHAGTLAFEMGYGRDRIVVNCGTSYGPTGGALRATAAHSTLIVADTNSAEILQGGGLGRRPSRVDCTREEMDGKVWTTASHDGYAERFGLVHRRRLYLSDDGDNLRGEDTLVPMGIGGSMLSFAVRFHLHPEIQASLVHNSAAVLLRQPSGVGWRFQCSGGELHLEDSIYFGHDLTSRPTVQIAIAASTHRAAAVVKWAFQRISVG